MSGSEESAKASVSGQRFDSLHKRISSRSDKMFVPWTCDRRRFKYVRQGMGHDRRLILKPLNCQFCIECPGSCDCVFVKNHFRMMSRIDFPLIGGKTRTDKSEHGRHLLTDKCKVVRAGPRVVNQRVLSEQLFGAGPQTQPLPPRRTP